MKVLAALALCGLVAVAYSAAVFDAQPEVPVDFAAVPECPISTNGDVVLVANPDNCTTYYSCIYQTPILMPCPKGLHFNNKYKVCDFPFSACCDPLYDPEHKCEKSD